MPLVRLSEDEEPAPNLAPMIDVVLVLTIFFMCATKFSGDERKFDLELPQAANATAVQGPRPEIVEVDASGGLRLGSETLEIGVLADRLRLLRESRPDLTVMIRGARTVPHGRMAEVYDACRAAEVRHVAISVKARADVRRE
ncbi:MAG: biopolymer transporter ExbD [Planctomycetia bacterium]|nr:biopolymer transporter ExbD [Planctomycetia bacterium]